MFKNKFIGKRRQAQHIVEFALVFPLLILVFAYAFQIMAETFVQSRFSYLFTNSVKQAINEMQTFKGTREQYYESGIDFRDKIVEVLNKNFHVKEQDSTFGDVVVGLIESETMTFVVGTFDYRKMSTIFQRGGSMYLNFIAPVSTSYTKPMILDFNQENGDLFFKGLARDFMYLHVKRYYDWKEGQENH